MPDLHCGFNYFSGHAFATQLIPNPASAGLFTSITIGLACLNAYIELLDRYNKEACPQNPGPPSCKHKRGAFAFEIGRITSIAGEVKVEVYWILEIECMDDPNLAKAEPYYYTEGFAALTKARDEYLKTHH